MKQQKEKGVERFDPRKKELELQEQKRRQEAKEEREKQKELRRKRQEESKKQLGLDMFNAEALAKHHEKMREVQEQEKNANEKDQAKKLQHIHAWDKPA